ncbi:hypothetical protein [Streptomyces sp. NPDC097640]|uniref:hypothetical protein n=1 Tax=Streptomyces sp. NPDC097640 TaxID=3157229 RepID=UPI00331D8647
MTLLALTACAVLAGARSLLVVSERVADAPPALTPAYVAPEQIRGLESSPATDLWGLGATLFYAAEASAAFGGPSPTAAMAAVLTDPPLTPRRAGSLGPLLIGLLAKDPGDRPAPARIRSDLSQLTLRI